MGLIEQLRDGVVLRERLRAVPMRVFAGTADACFAAEPTREYAAALGAELELFEGAGHDLMLEPCAEELAQRIDRWIVEDLKLD